MPCRKPRFRRVREIRYSPAYRNDKLIRPFLLATSFARVLHRPLSLPGNRGRREDRVHAAPAISCAIAHKERAHEHTGTGGASRPSLRSGFTGLLRALPGERLFCHRRLREASLLSDLMPAPRHQDHTTSPYARTTHVSRSSRVHRIPPRVRDVRERPSHRVRRTEICG
jgi:hypothetical protein